MNRGSHKQVTYLPININGISFKRQYRGDTFISIGPGRITDMELVEHLSKAPGEREAPCTDSGD